ncbi:MAG TPA: DEAD/DEAH box helicase [Acidimicrobiales bacterium]|nr:DEAD/DEAH box helicase [Acidimicrobiales bacterium]
MTASSTFPALPATLAVPASTTTTFAALGVPAEAVERLARRKITEPFPIQAATLPDALAGRDVCGKAPTGSGKTLAFGIPLVQRQGRAKPRRPRALVLVPTRELAAQVHKELSLLAGPRGRSVATFYGGVGFGAQLNALRKGVDIAVACPGRLADLVNRGECKLSDVDMVVLDEADRMADMGFLPEVRRLLDQVRPDRQTLLFSATLDGDVDVLIRHYQKDPVTHELAAEEDAAQSRHVFWQAEREDRVALTARVVKAEWPTMVFCRTKHGADRLATQLGRAGVSAAAIHGDRSQNQRERALASFASGRVQALVATDIAARGIHVDGVACVVHFDPPADEKDYLHRSGRTGRAGASGTVLSLVGREQVADVRKLQARLALPTGIDAPDHDGLGDDRHLARPVATTGGGGGGGGGSQRSGGGTPRRGGGGGGGAPRSRGSRGRGTPAGRGAGGTGGWNGGRSSGRPGGSGGRRAGSSAASSSSSSYGRGQRRANG